MPREVNTISGFNVSRETFEGLSHFAQELEKWNKKINLVAPSTIENLWSRHIADSLQLTKYASETIEHWADFGSGAGLPALIAGYVLRDKWEKLTFVESDQRKATFLRKMGRELGLNINVRAERIEAISPLAADLISARALADLDKLFTFSYRHKTDNVVLLFPKGRNWSQEVEAARQNWRFELELFSSMTEEEARILKVTALEARS